MLHTEMRNTFESQKPKTFIKVRRPIELEEKNQVKLETIQ